MAFHIRDAETDALVRELAQKTRLGITEAVKLAASEALAVREKEQAEKLARMRAISDRLAALPGTGHVADKAFFDELSGD